jgi:hypothetical protein
MTARDSVRVSFQIEDAKAFRLSVSIDRRIKCVAWDVGDKAPSFAVRSRASGAMIKSLPPTMTISESAFQAEFTAKCTAYIDDEHAMDTKRCWDLEAVQLQAYGRKEGIDLSVQQRSSYRAVSIYTKEIGTKPNRVENANLSKTPCVLLTHAVSIIILSSIYVRLLFDFCQTQWIFNGDARRRSNRVSNLPWTS